MGKLTGKTIVISSTNANGTTTVGINGRNRVLPHNTEIPVSDAELGVLENSHVQFEVKGNASAAELRVAVDYDGKDAIEAPIDRHPAGADYLDGSSPSGPVVAVALTPEADDTPAGADHLTQTGVTVDEDAAREDALRRQQEAQTGDQEPVVELQNTDPNQTGADQSQTTATGANEGGAGEQAGAGLTVDPFDAEKTLEQTIPQITEDMDEFSKDQLEQLLAAEKKGEKRVTLIEALERKIASA